MIMQKKHYSLEELLDFHEKRDEVATYGAMVWITRNAEGAEYLAKYLEVLYSVDQETGYWGEYSSDGEFAQFPLCDIYAWKSPQGMSLKEALHRGAHLSGKQLVGIVFHTKGGHTNYIFRYENYRRELVGKIKTVAEFREWLYQAEAAEPPYSINIWMSYVLPLVYSGCTTLELREYVHMSITCRLSKETQRA
jgi:hypothetical protein